MKANTTPTGNVAPLKGEGNGTSQEPPMSMATGKHTLEDTKCHGQITVSGRS